MTRHDLEVLDTIGTPDYLKGELSDNGRMNRSMIPSPPLCLLTDVDVPSHMVPPNPEDSDVLPSQVHPSYPYGNPLNIKHPAARPRRPYDPSSRALFEDMGYSGGGVNGSLRWKDLALDTLFPVDEEQEAAEKAAQARKMASGASASHPPPPPSAPAPVEGGDGDEEHDENEDGGDEDEDNDENLDGLSVGDDEA
ncbi:uncharacterized protein FIBRA_04673 [Fibroporia radiculosa]|uniref:Uncharacterized protein n=1 Tax=Fibroporia radiculosa TaxID=599839 RepID=J4GPM4_9APHY|nr:uncharacterized protein FIBRA_04673 [Fibroporia radiculosa]CCM02570.1 predicted protein [Fibroporia radiculosa]